MTSLPSADPEPDGLLELHDRWLNGDREALEELLRQVQPWIRSEIAKEMTPEDRVGRDSLDLAQSAVLNFLKAKLRFAPKSGRQLCSLLRRIAHNELIDGRRRSRPGRTGHLESLQQRSSIGSLAVAGRSSLLPDREAERSSERDWVRLALQFLSEEERYILVAREVEGLDWITIARELDMDAEDEAVAANTVRMRCARLKPRVANMIRKLRGGSLPDEA